LKQVEISGMLISYDLEEGEKNASENCNILSAALFLYVGKIGSCTETRTKTLLI